MFWLPMQKLKAKYGATAAAARYKLASDAVTQALIAQTAAQTAANATASIGARALALVGGQLVQSQLGDCFICWLHVFTKPNRRS